MTLDNQGLDLSPINSGGDDSVLAAIWRKILRDLDADESALYDRIERLAEKVSKEHPEKASQIRGNLRTDIAKSAMTWFTFKKVLRVIDTQYFEMEFNLTHLNGKSKHTLRVTLDDNFLEKESDKPSDLSTFFRQIQYDLGIGITKYEELLESYMRREKLVVDLRNKTNVRGYLKKDFSSPKMTWRTFMKTLVFLCVIRAEIKITLTNSRGSVSSHSYTILLGDLEDYLEEMRRERNDFGI